MKKHAQTMTMLVSDLTEQSDHFALLRLMETPGIGAARANSIIEAAGRCGLSLGEFVNQSNGSKAPINPKQVEIYRANEARVLELWYKLVELGVKLFSIMDDAYPHKLRAQLGKKAPPIIMALGNEALFDKVSVGFCGSRKATEKGLTTARDCVEQLSDYNINSGYAAGVDMTTHRKALETGGTTTIVLAEGILHFKKKKLIEDLWDWNRILLISEFLPGLPWSVRNAMQRNKTICALSDAMILIEASEKGGSIEAGRAALSMGVPLFAPVYEGMPDSAEGNRLLLNQGAVELKKSRKTGKANLEKLMKKLGTIKLTDTTNNIHYSTEAAQPGQLALFDKVEDICKRN